MRYQPSLAHSVRRFIAEEAGADLVEYALLAGLMGVAGFLVLSQYVGGVNGLLDIVVTRLNQLSQ